MLYWHQIQKPGFKLSTPNEVTIPIPLHSGNKVQALSSIDASRPHCQSLISRLILYSVTCTDVPFTGIQDKGPFVLVEQLTRMYTVIYGFPRGPFQKRPSLALEPGLGSALKAHPARAPEGAIWTRHAQRFATAWGDNWKMKQVW